MIRKIIYLLFLLFISFNVLFAQQEPILSASDQNKANNYISLAEKYLKQNNKNIAVSNYNKAGMLYWENGSNSNAIGIFKKSLELTKQLENKNGIRVLNNYLAFIYTDKEQNDSALFYFNKALEVTRKMDNKDKLIESLNNVAITLKTLGKHNEAIAVINEALPLALTNKNKPKVIRACYKELADNYEAVGDMKQWKLYIDLWNNFNNMVMVAERLELEKKQAVAFAQATAARLKLKLEKANLALARDSIENIEKLTKEQRMEIELLNKAKQIDSLQIQQKEAQIEKARNERYILFGIIGFILLIFLLLFLQFRQKKKANKLLAQKNELLEQQKNEISMKNLTLRDLNATLQKKKNEVEAGNKKLAKANKELEKKNITINQSIVYASKIQEAILPSKKAILQNFPESFIFYRPRDIVSGDFYWFSEKNGKCVLAAVDCTGHSVPGAFMSMIGNTLLNEIVNEKKILHPGAILDNLHVGILKNLNQESDDEELKDGMDITLCVIDTKNQELEIAAANHSVFIIRDNELNEVEGDIFSIGDDMFLDKKVEFTNHTIPIESELSVYLMSDGYQDQFGGKNDQKFMKKRLKKMLLDNHSLSMNEQYNVISKAFDDWKGDYRQVDDVLLIGLKFGA